MELTNLNIFCDACLATHPMDFSYEIYLKNKACVLMDELDLCVFLNNI